MFRIISDLFEAHKERKERKVLINSISEVLAALNSPVLNKAASTVSPWAELERLALLRDRLYYGEGEVPAIRAEYFKTLTDLNWRYLEAMGIPCAKPGEGNGSVLKSVSMLDTAAEVPEDRDMAKVFYRHAVEAVKGIENVAAITSALFCEK